MRCHGKGDVGHEEAAMGELGLGKIQGGAAMADLM
jgi:hypothetical protein